MSLHAPSIVLVEPQMGENIGGAARAMMNCGLRDLRLVSPRDGWPNQRANALAAHAKGVVEDAKLFHDLTHAVGDSHWVIATTARTRGMNKPILTPAQAADEALKRARSGQRIAVLFGRESDGLTNDEVAQANAVLTVPLDPANTSLNLAQAVLLFGYEWYQRASDQAVQTHDDAPGELASAELVNKFMDRLVAELDDTGFLGVPEKRDRMIRNIRNIFMRQDLNAQELQTLHGIITHLRTR